jgi:DNA-nicking Smr family endonuclease
MSPKPVTIPIEGQLDLHPFEPCDVGSVVEEYLHAAFRSGLRTVRIVHGRGKGIQRGIVHDALERHPRVEEFWDDTGSHLGATIARLQSVV